MATTRSSDPPTPTDEKSLSSETVQPANGVQQEVTAEATKESAPTSVFANKEPIREDQVQNAVKFLSHPRVRGSPVIQRRSFLERKGLTKDEIDEAFCRVPDPPPSSHAATTNQADGLRTSSNVQPQGQIQAVQTGIAAPVASPSSVLTIARPQFRWYHAVIAVGALAATGAGTAVLIKNSILPRFKSWIRKIVLEEDSGEPLQKATAKPSYAEETAAAAKAAAAAAADAARASQEMLNTRNQEKRYFEEFTQLLDVQVQELKSMSSAIRKLEGQNLNTVRTYTSDPEDYGGRGYTSLQKPYANGKADFDSRSGRSSSPPVSVEPSNPPHPKSYMDIMAMLQRGERPPNIRDINDLPPNPNQQPSNPRIAPKPKPWESGQLQSRSTQSIQSQASGEGFTKVQDFGAEMESSIPWWARRNPRITEIETEDQSDAASYGLQNQTSEPPVQRTWLPPQPPPVAMPEAAEAIKRPKQRIQQVADDQKSSEGPGVTNELQRVTKASESGGELYNSGDGSGSSASGSGNSAQVNEIQEE